ncbi:hypothetical protein ACVGOW_15275 [Pseudonocardia saturnea]
MAGRRSRRSSRAPTVSAGAIGGVPVWTAGATSYGALTLSGAQVDAMAAGHA